MATNYIAEERTVGPKDDQVHMTVASGELPASTFVLTAADGGAMVVSRLSHADAIWLYAALGVFLHG